MQTERLQAFGASEIFTRHDAAALGIDSRTLTNLVRSGVVARVAHGIYRTGAMSTAQDLEAVTRSMKVAISHDSAAAWHGGSLPHPPDRLQVTGPRNRKSRSSQIQLHRSDVSAAELTVVRGVTVTTPVRTVLDVARTKRIAEAVAIADSLCRLGRLSPAEVENAAGSLAAGPGRPAALRVASLVDPRAESVFESITRVDLALAGMPPPVPQLSIFDRGDWLARVDFAWPEARVVLECDGFEFHGNREAFERDRRRWSALTRAGWRVVVVTWRDVLGDSGYLTDLIGDLLHTSTHN